MWTASRLVALRKPNGKIRPIAVGDVWLRLLGKCVAKDKAADAGKVLAPLNLGVGIPGGAEIVVHAANLYARLLRARQVGAISLEDDDDPYCMLATDFTNAFNTLHRREMAAAIDERFPDLLPLFNWSYGHGAALRLGTGFRVCYSSTGVRQGDPLGPLFFCLGIQRILEEMKKAHPEVHFMFYLDDGTLFGRRSHLIKAFFDFKDRCAKIGLILNTDKSVGWDPTVDGKSAVQGGLTWMRDGIKILGGPIGGALSGPAGTAETFAEAFAASQLEKFAEVIPHLRHLPPTIGFALLTTCINARPTYLARTTEPTQFNSAAATFDDAVDVGLAQVAEWEGVLPEVAKRVRGLPRVEGGCSLRRMVSCSEPAYAASFIHAADVISSDHKWLWQLVLEHNMLGGEHTLISKLVPTFTGFSTTGVNFQPTEDPAALPQNLVKAGEDYDSYVEQIAATDSSRLLGRSSGRYLPAVSAEVARAIADQEDGRLPRGLRQKDLTGPLDKAEQLDIVSLLRDREPGLSAMFLSGKCDPSGVFMRLDALADRRHTKIGDPSFVTNLRIRLLLPLQNNQVSRTCPCGKKGNILRPGWDDYHALECGLAGSATLINKRHNSVRDLLVMLLPNLLQGKGQVKVAKEQEYESVALSGKSFWEIDVELSFVSVNFGPSTFLLDVAVTHPGGANHLRGGSNLRVGAAAHAMERRKDTQWGKVLGDKKAGVSFVPFIVETGGFLGKKAVAFLDLICGVKKKGDAKTARGRTYLIRAILTAVANANHSLSGFHQSKVREFGVHYNPSPSPPRRFEELVESPEETAALYATDSDEEADEVGTAHPPLPDAPAHTPPPVDDYAEVETFLDALSPPAPFEQTERNIFAATVGTHGLRAFADSTKACSDSQQPFCRCPTATGCKPSSCRNAVGRIECSELNCVLRKENPKLCSNQRIQSASASKHSEVTRKHGVWGLYASEPMTRGDLIGEYVGLVTPVQGFVFPHDGPTLALPYSPSRLGSDPHSVRTCNTLISTAGYGNFTRFLGHDCIANCEAQLWWVNTLPHLAIIAKEDIDPGVRLTVNYGQEGGIFAAACSPRDGSCTCQSCVSGRDPRGSLAVYTDGSAKKYAAKALAGAAPTATSASWGLVFVQRPHFPRGAICDKEAGSVVCDMYGPVVVNPLTPDGHEHPFFLGATLKSNNTGELTGIIEAMLYFKHYSDRDAVTIYTDSQVTQQLVLGVREPTSNIRLVFSARSLFKEMASHISIVWVQAHSGKKWNERADKLADCGMTMCCRVGRYGDEPPLRDGFPADIAPARGRGHRQAQPLTVALTAVGRQRIHTPAVPTPRCPPHLPAPRPSPPSLSRNLLRPPRETKAIWAAIRAIGAGPLDATAPALSDGGDLALGFFHFSPFPYKPPSAWRYYELRQRALWGMIVDSLRQSERRPAERLADLIRESPLCLLTTALKVPRRVTEGGLGSGNIKGDGLCGFRAAYCAYLRSIGAPATDPDLHNAEQRRAFLAWLAGRRDALTEQIYPEIAAKIQTVIDWISSEQGFGGKEPNPWFSKTGNAAWFSFNYFGPPEARLSGLRRDTIDGALFCGDKVPVMAVQVPTLHQRDTVLNKHGTPAAIMESFSVSTPAPYDHLRSLLSSPTAPTLIFFRPEHFWLLDMPNIRGEGIEEALGRLATLTIDRVIDAIANPPPPRGKEAPNNPAGDEVTDLSDDAECRESEEQPPRDCTSCGPGTTVLGYDQCHWRCGHCLRAHGAETFKHHCLQCNSYFCTKCPGTGGSLRPSTASLTSPSPPAPPHPQSTVPTNASLTSELSPAVWPDSQAAPRAASFFGTNSSAFGPHV